MHGIRLLMFTTSYSRYISIAGYLTLGFQLKHERWENSGADWGLAALISHSIATRSVYWTVVS